jgi:hypothetical protein
LISKKLLCIGVSALFFLSIVVTAFPSLNLNVGSAAASPTFSQGWFYSGWQYRQAHDITNNQPLGSVNFFSLSTQSPSILGNPSNQHTLQPVHGSTIIEVDEQVDGNTWKYLAYDSDPLGSQIRLFYTNDTSGTWTPYSQNPILGPQADYYRWPSTTYLGGVFYMFVEDYTGGTLELWSSTDGIHYTFVQNVVSGGNQYKNPFIYLNPNDNNWYLYYHDSSGSIEYIKVTSASTISGLAAATRTIVVSNDGPLGSPSITYYNGKYWLLGEILPGSLWQIVAYSSSSPTSGFTLTANSPILTNDEACPMLYLTPDQTHAYLYETVNSAVWTEYTRQINLNSATTLLSTDLSNYQVSVNVNYGSGTSNGNTVYLNSHSQTNFGDVRFTWYNSSSNSEVACPYWIEQSTSGVNATFWVKLPQILGTANSTLYLYYGNSSVATTSSGASTFEFFDDFSGTLNQWTSVGGTWQIQNGELVAQTSSYGQRLRANNFVFGNDTVHLKAEWISGTYFEGGPYIRGQAPNEQSNGYMNLLSAWPNDNRERISLMNGTEATLSGQGTTNPSKNVWYTYVFKASGNVLKSTITPIYPTEINATNSLFATGTLCLFAWSGAAENIHYDNVFVTKAAISEPLQLSWYGEEKMPISSSVVVDKSSVSAGRVDVASTQTVGYHVQWSNGSSITTGKVYVNSTQYSVNSTGWISLNPVYSDVTSATWLITAVNCGGVTTFSVTAPVPSIIWDQIAIVDGGLTKNPVSLGDNTTVWFKANYQYDNAAFAGTSNQMQVNGLPMTWSAVNSRWESTYTASAPGTTALSVSSVTDKLYNLTQTNDKVGPLNLMVYYQPFTVLSNSTVSEFAFNSTVGALSFTVSGQSGTTGFVNLTVAKALISDINHLQVYLDGNPLTYSSSSTDYFYIIQFNYHHSTHHVLVSLGTQSAPEPTQTANFLTQNSTLATTPGYSSAYTILGLTIVALALSVALLMRHRRVKNRG